METTEVSEPGGQRLGRQAAFGGILMVAARLTTRFIDLVMMLVLTRILRPVDFGLVAIALSLVSVVDAILDLPLNQALLRLPLITKAHLDTAFTVSFFRAVLLGAVILMAAWPFGIAYGDNRLIPLVCVLSLSPISRGLTSPRLAEFQKKMSFWRDFSVELTGKLVSFTVGIVVALATDSYWAIAVTSVTYPLAMACESYRLAPYRPRFTLAELPIFYGFVGWMSASQVINALNWQLERLLIGQVRPIREVGLFSTASDIASIPFAAMFGPVMRPLLAAFTHLHDKKEQLARSYQNASNALIAIGLPVMVGESLLAEPAVRVVLGEKWLAAVPLVRWLSLSLIPALFALPTVPLLMAFGKTKILLYRNLLELSVKLPMAVGGLLLFGFAGLIVSRFTSEVFADLFCILVVRRLTGLSIADQILAPWRSIVATGIMAAVVMISLRDVAPGPGVADAVLYLAVAGIVGGASYTAVCWGLWRIAGCPAGVEAMVSNAALGVIGKGRRYLMPRG